MDPLIQKKLLKDKRVVNEIHRHLWIESEKVGEDKGLEWAKADWLEKFSKAWMEYHVPQQKRPSVKNSNETLSTKKPVSTKTRTPKI
jgi:hypothetical protein